ncbi:hypothetical protein ACIPYQ_40370 [Streptomyces sp. NPDC090045]|uniref:hypothetical protein n=1 Tax=Streptomyces sp. NPDC090045 TaxID=3365927 RepID=UPI0038062EAD
MSSGERGDPTVVRVAWAQAHQRFSPGDGWGLDGLDGDIAMTLAVLSSRRSYWDLHAFAIGYWHSFDTPPSELIPALAKGGDGIVGDFIDYVNSPWPDVGLDLPTSEEIRASSVVLEWAVRKREFFDRAATQTLESLDPIVDECIFRFPNDGPEFYECIKRATE